MMEDKRFAVLLDTNMDVKLVEREEDESFLDFCYKTIGCECIDAVAVQNNLPADHDYRMIVDDNGLLGEEPICNFIASYLYGTTMHGSPIVGRALLMAEDDTDEGRDFVFLTFDEAMKLISVLDGIAGKAYRGVHARLSMDGVLVEG